MTAREKFANVKKVRLARHVFRKAQPSRLNRTGVVVGFGSWRDEVVLVRVVWEGSKTPIVYHMDNLEAAE
jgi:hypothetical protein